MYVCVCAGRLAKEGARYGIKGLVADPEEEDMEELQQLKVKYIFSFFLYICPSFYIIYSNKVFYLEKLLTSFLIKK